MTVRQVSVSLQKAISFCPIGVSVAASVVMTSDEGGIRAALNCLNCHVVCVGSGGSGDIVMSASLLTTEILPDSPGPRH